MLIRSPEELALVVANQRKKLGLSQVELADRVGLKQKTISAFENKASTVKVSTLFKILSAVNLGIDVIDKENFNRDKKQWEHEW